MVTGVDAFRQRVRSVLPRIEQKLRPALERYAKQIVAQMNVLKPIPEIEIDWSWGSAPDGSMSLGTVQASSGDKLVITIYATATTAEYAGGFPAVARWFEFGTAPRFHRSGKYSGEIAPQPYFWPAYRANSKRVKSGLAAAVRKEIKAIGTL